MDMRYYGFDYIILCCYFFANSLACAVAFRVSRAKQNSKSSPSDVSAVGRVVCAIKKKLSH